jgi:Uncharacterised nucleotidyltransferase
VTKPDPVGRALSDIAAFGLPGARPPTSFAPDDEEWEALRARILLQRVTGLAVGSAEYGWLRLDDGQREGLLADHRDAMTWSVYVEQKLLRLAGLLEEAGIGFAVLKGASVAHTAYPEPCLRSFGDVDLLVRTADYERTCALLDVNGHIRQRPEPRPHFEVRFGKASVHKDPSDNIEIDLHRTLVLGPYGLWIDPEELLDRVVPFTLGGRQLPRLDDTGMFVNVAMHAALGSETPRLVPLRDIAEFAAGCEPDARVLRDWCDRWHLNGVLRRAARQVRERLGVHLAMLVEFERLTVAARDERLLEAYSSKRGAGGIATAALAAIPSMRAKAAYVWALTVPRRQFLRARMPSNASYHRRWRRALERVRASGGRAGA